MNFLGVVDLGLAHNILLTALVAGLQYGVMWFSVSRTKKGSGKMTAEKEMAQKTQQQLMLYFFPVLMAVISYSLPAAVGIYFATTNAVSLGQELIIRQQLKSKA